MESGSEAAQRIGTACDARRRARGRRRKALVCPSGLPYKLLTMPQVQLIIDLVTPEIGRRRAQRAATLAGVPAVGDYVDPVPGPTLALHVRSVRWHAIEERITLFLDGGRSDRPGMTDHDGELELADHMIDDLRKAGWDIGEYE